MPGRTEPLRPEPKRRAADAVAEWVRWVGLGRLVASAISVVVVVAGVFWLLQAPAPAAESSLPVASAPPAGGAATPAATLPPPGSGAGAVTGSSAPTTSLPVGPIVVHVAGAVARPGLVTLEPHSRAGDAVAAAGGPSADADLDALNLAAPLADGQRVYVPMAGEVDPASLPSAPVAAGPGTTVAAGPIDVNRATAADLEQLPGVGPSTAQAIVDDRDRNGPFASVDDLDRVRGIGPAKLDALRELVTV